MIHVRPSFQIEVTEEIVEDAKNIVHRKATHTSKICREVNPLANCVDHIQVEKRKDEAPEILTLKSFYTNIAKELSDLNEQQLVENFADLRICFKHTRSEKKYEFTF